MKEYFNNPNATEDFFYKDINGNMWGCTGDIGYMDSDGFLFVLGRFNDSFTSVSGKRVFCFDVEDIILRHEAVNRCKVVGVEHNGNELAIAHIVLEVDNDTDKEKLLGEIHKLCTENLNSEYVPYGYIIRQAMPIKNSGKLNIEQLKSENSGIMCMTAGGIKVIDL